MLPGKELLKREGPADGLGLEVRGTRRDAWRGQNVEGRGVSWKGGV